MNIPTAKIRTAFLMMAAMMIIAYYLQELVRHPQALAYAALALVGVAALFCKPTWVLVFLLLQVVFWALSKIVEAIDAMFIHLGSTMKNRQHKMRGKDVGAAIFGERSSL